MPPFYLLALSKNGRDLSAPPVDPGGSRMPHENQSCWVLASETANQGALAGDHRRSPPNLGPISANVKRKSREGLRPVVEGHRLLILSPNTQLGLSNQTKLG